MPRQVPRCSNVSAAKQKLCPKTCQSAVITTKVEFNKQLFNLRVFNLSLYEVDIANSAAFTLYYIITSYPMPARGIIVNPLSPDMKMHILLTVLHTFLMELVRRIFV